MFNTQVWAQGGLEWAKLMFHYDFYTFIPQMIKAVNR